MASKSGAIIVFRASSGSFSAADMLCSKFSTALTMLALCGKKGSTAFSIIPIALFSRVSACLSIRSSLLMLSIVFQNATFITTLLMNLFSSPGPKPTSGGKTFFSRKKKQTLLARLLERRRYHSQRVALASTATEASVGGGLVGSVKYSLCSLRNRSTSCGACLCASMTLCSSEER